MTLQEIKRIGEFTANTAHLNVMCKRIKDNPAKVYEIMAEYGGDMDSWTRESIFSYIADKYYKGNYDRVYNAWLGV